MNPIIQFAMEWQYLQIKEGRNAKTIRLTTEQIEYLEGWLRANHWIICIADPKLTARQLCGMEVIEV